MNYLFSVCFEGDDPLDIITCCSINCSLGFPVAVVLAGTAAFFAFFFGHLKLVLNLRSLHMYLRF